MSVIPFIFIYIFSVFVLSYGCKFVIEENYYTAINRLDELDGKENINSNILDGLGDGDPMFKVMAIFTIPIFRWIVAYGTIFICTASEEQWEQFLDRYN